MSAKTAESTSWSSKIIRFKDVNGNGLDDCGETVYRDSNGSGAFEEGEDAVLQMPVCITEGRLVSTERNRGPEIVHEDVNGDGKIQCSEAFFSDVNGDALFQRGKDHEVILDGLSCLDETGHPINALPDVNFDVTVLTLEDLNLDGLNQCDEIVFEDVNKDGAFVEDVDRRVRMQTCFSSEGERMPAGEEQTVRFVYKDLDGSKVFSCGDLLSEDPERERDNSEELGQDMFYHMGAYCTGLAEVLQVQSQRVVGRPYVLLNDDGDGQFGCTERHYVDMNYNRRFDNGVDVPTTMRTVMCVGENGQELASPSTDPDPVLLAPVQNSALVRVLQDPEASKHIASAPSPSSPSSPTRGHFTTRSVTSPSSSGQSTQPPTHSQPDSPPVTTPHFGQASSQPPEDLYDSSHTSSQSAESSVHSHPFKPFPVTSPPIRHFGQTADQRPVAPVTSSSPDSSPASSGFRATWDIPASGPDLHVVTVTSPSIFATSSSQDAHFASLHAPVSGTELTAESEPSIGVLPAEGDITGHFDFLSFPLHSLASLSLDEMLPIAEVPFMAGSDSCTLSELESDFDYVSLPFLDQMDGLGPS